MFRKNQIPLVIVLVSLFLCSCSNPARTTLGELGTESGHLLIVGGGQRPDRVMQLMCEHASGHGTGKIVVVPTASGVPLESGPGQAEQIRELGDNEVVWYHITRENADADSTLDILEGAGGVWFTGGSQSRITAAMNGTRALERVKEIYRNGGIIGGTSAGAAIMSELMITGDEKRPVYDDRSFRSIETENVVTTEGFGLIKGVIIDQHFVRRQRENRLISLVIENPQYVGIGIDEQTAILRKPDNTLEVIGNSNILIFDATDAVIGPVNIPQSYSLSASNMKFHVLTEGQVYDLKNLTVAEKN